MRISELARQADVTIPTVKFYLRQGLLPDGEATAVTRAEYNEEHLSRVRLIRALVDVGGLSLTAVRALLATLDEHAGADAPASANASRPKKPARAARLDRKKVLAAVQDALPPAPPERQQTPNRALAAVSALGWEVDPESVALRQLEAALAALDLLGLPPNIATLLAYGEAAEKAAQADVDSLPAGSSAKVVRQLVLATAMYEPMLTALHRLAQQNALAKSR